MRRPARLGWRTHTFKRSVARRISSTPCRSIGLHDTLAESIGTGDLEAILAETITVAVKTKAVSHRQLERAEKILGQQASDKNKLYALHAPEVECIGKGKARTKYEFGVKTSIATTNERYKGGQFVLGAMALPGAPMTAIHWRTRLIRSQSLPERL